MAETVSTGGNISFKYGKGHDPRFSDSQKKEIKNAYTQADERKRKSRKKKLIIILTLLIIATIILGTIFLR